MRRACGPFCACCPARQATGASLVRTLGVAVVARPPKKSPTHWSRITCFAKKGRQPIHLEKKTMTKYIYITDSIRDYPNTADYTNQYQTNLKTLLDKHSVNGWRLVQVVVNTYQVGQDTAIFEKEANVT